MHPETGAVVRSRSTNLGDYRITGMAYDDDLEGIWVSKGNYALDQTQEPIRLLDHNAFVINEFPQPAPSCHAIAVSGDYLVISADRQTSNGNDLYLLDKSSGAVLNQVEIQGGHFASGLSALLDHLIINDAEADEIFIMHPSNEIVGRCIDAPGTASSPTGLFLRGTQAIAADTITDLNTKPAPFECALGPGTASWQNGLCDPALPWNPTPWATRHRIYVANETNQQIYGGYLSIA